jgi:hypothetical protein
MGTRSARAFTTTKNESYFGPGIVAYRVKRGKISDFGPPARSNYLSSVAPFFKSAQPRFKLVRKEWFRIVPFQSFKPRRDGKSASVVVDDPRT